MKKNLWLTFSMLLSTTLLAQQPTNTPAATPPSPPAAVKPAPVPTAVVPAPNASPKPDNKIKPAKPAKAAEVSKPSPDAKPIFLSPGKAIVTGNNVNVRGKATIFSEIVKRLNSGDSVTVIEQVIRDNPRSGEPSQWAKIAIPADVHVWIHSSYVDATNKVVLPKRLNVRTGPGENYSVVGLLEKGAPIKEVSTKGNWMQIEAPADAYAFVAAVYLKQEGIAPTVPPVVSIASPVQDTPTPVIIPEAPSVASTTTDAPSPAPAPAPVTPEPAADADTEPAPPPAEEPPPKRIIQHEGIVKNTWSIQAPTRFALVDATSGKTVNYLYTSSTNLDLGMYKGMHIIVTGEEGLDERWRNTPIITIQRIQVVQ